MSIAYFLFTDWSLFMHVHTKAIKLRDSDGTIIFVQALVPLTTMYDHSCSLLV